jgi:hypothetical protein
MIRIGLSVFALMVTAGVANAEPLKLTDVEMDRVTAGLTVNGKVLIDFTLDQNGTADPSDDVPTMEVVAGGQSVFLPAEVHDNNAGESVGFVGTGPWSAALSHDTTGSPIDHAPVTIVHPAPPAP